MQDTGVLLQIGSFQIRWYGVLIAAAMLLGVVLAAREAKRLGYSTDDLVDAALVLLPLGVIGARIYFVIFSWDLYANDFWGVFKIWEGGLAIYGGIIGGAIGALLYCKISKKMRFWDLVDIAIPSVALGQAIGRWGNFFNQEAFGAAVTDPNLQFFPYAVQIQHPHVVNVGGVITSCAEPWHQATFFYESAWLLLVFAALLLYRRGKRKPSGNVFFLYLLLYGVERFVVEGMRSDSLYLFTQPFPLRVSQALSLVMVLVGAGMLAMRLVQQRRGTLKTPLAGAPLIVAAADGSVQDAQPTGQDESQPADRPERTPKSADPAEGEPGESEENPTRHEDPKS